MAKNRNMKKAKSTSLKANAEVAEEIQSEKPAKKNKKDR